MAKKTTTTKEVAKTLIIAPRLTEKASLLGNNNAYTFDVKIEATKLTLKDEIVKTYKVTPLKITMSLTKGKNVFTRGKWGKTIDEKKAMVFLKKGDSIKLA